MINLKIRIEPTVVPNVGINHIRPDGKFAPVPMRILGVAWSPWGNHMAVGSNTQDIFQRLIGYASIAKKQRELEDREYAKLLGEQEERVLLEA